MSQSDYPQRKEYKTETVGFQIANSRAKIFYSDGTGRGSLSRCKLDLCIVMAAWKRKRGIVHESFFTVFSFICSFSLLFFSVHMWVSLRRQITMRYFSSKVAPCRRTERNNRASFFLSADKERTVVKGKKVKKRKERRIPYKCISPTHTHFLFSSGNQEPSWHRRGPVNWKLCSYSNTPDILCRFSTQENAVQPKKTGRIQFIVGCFHSLAHCLHSIPRNSSRLPALDPNVYTSASAPEESARTKSRAMLVKELSANLKHLPN